VKFLMHIYYALPLPALLIPDLRVAQIEPSKYLITVRHFAVFSNWIMLRWSILSLPAKADVILDLSETRLVDHTVMEKLHELKQEFESLGRTLTIVGLDQHVAASTHPHAARVMNAVTPPKASSAETTSSNGHAALASVGEGLNDEYPDRGYSASVRDS
jgi:MFS superfamily sulfate permease-like transporter